MRQKLLFLAMFFALAGLILSTSFSRSPAQTNVAPAAPTNIIDPIAWLWPKESNTVTLRCLIGTNGKIKRIVSTDVSALLLPAFEKAKEHWSFTPATRNNKPVESVVTISFTYQLKPQGYRCLAASTDIGR